MSPSTTPVPAPPPASPPAGIAAPRPEAGRPASGIRLHSLTGLRWYAALLIFCYHFASEQSVAGTREHRALLRKALVAGPSAVSFFFILSGFVLAWSARPGDSRTGFWWRRFARIYPSHLAGFLLAVAMLLWMGRTLDPGVALANLTLTQAWVPDRTDWWFGYNGVSWSLCSEALFYLLFPFLMPLFRRLTTTGLRVAVAVGCLAVTLYPLCRDEIGRATGWSAKFTLYIAPPVRLAEFAIGVALALLVRRGAWRGPGVTVSLALCAGAVLWLARQVPNGFHWSACTVVPYTLAVAAVARADAEGRRSVFRDRVHVYLGEVSFAFYLVHEMVIFSANHAFRGYRLALVPHVVIVFTVSLAGALLLHELVERPGVRALAAVTRRRSARGSVPGSAPGSVPAQERTNPR
ncbi:acyltransferase family protein [Streptomyces huiliensis]|uniref:acyltransferase family protein n=1 Tax=Streptomyces huiliensis TaxID=2876027 RepID=UPI001CBDC97C|nr:acyltransferase [Streptomyces huiliensis]MBZ4321087.1 acyltransferase [Streptomyces huiliensis]